jgi:hypothetical protein
MTAPLGGGGHFAAYLRQSGNWSIMRIWLQRVCRAKSRPQYSLSHRNVLSGRWHCDPIQNAPADAADQGDAKKKERDTHGSSRHPCLARELRQLLEQSTARPR